MAEPVRRWWRQQDQFDWFTVYLRDRELQLRWRLATFGFTAILAALPIVLLGSPVGPDHALTRAVAVTCAVCGASASVLWLRRWPTRNQSLIFNIVCSLGIAATCLAMSNPYNGLMGCTLFAAVGGFLAYFHALSHMLVNLAVAMLCSAITAVRLLSDTGDVSLTVAALLTVVALNVGVPFGIESLVHTLRTDLRNSDRDPLTGLLDRRGFYNALHELAVTRHAGGGHLNVTMIDLDDFKKVNDTHGHAAGDEVLVNVGAVLRRTCRTDALLCRLGGEEFVVADSDEPGQHVATMERLRCEIATVPYRVTASFGICTVPADPGMARDRPEFVEHLIRVADSAMYRSKREGGNRLHHQHLDQVIPD
ncbi:diguanylate cyclase [Mycobacterium sp. GA-2829]|uniref:GGDEF domain-containing protein n=1 Tax=Mycobacterium sp. GA-2829 TaxID=1772283 RepID=UPI00073FBB92|nr:GGDEF domain-containing protein [Mycobacterium sp. GA-2829]KUI20112.1 diguanylate cyclase [Mycobacterium sp. GA-2829]